MLVAEQPSTGTTVDSLYPPSPERVPAEITRLSAAYRFRVVAMIGGLFLFLLLYLVFIALAGLLAYWLLVMPMPDVRGRGIIMVFVFKFGGALAALLLWLFLIKGLFKGQRVDRSGYLELAERDHPALCAFIRRVYQDTGAPPPCRIYISWDVNAALVYNTSLINLVLPPRKDLLIGLGLVNVLHLSEFKAVLAHEFGHFAQRSTGLGSYLYVANRVLYDVIYSRDALDRFVDGWAAQDIRFSFPAWGLKGVLWVVRKALGGTFEGLNLIHLSLSRQMEFNADNVAVSVTGSDALIHGLSRCAFAGDCLGDAAQALNDAADHGLFTDDLFYHQARAAGRLRRLRKDERAGLPPDLPADPTQTVQVFTPVDDGIPDRYRSHPTDHMREANAKRLYVRGPHDGRAPWLLFGDLAGLKRQVTERFYRYGLGRQEDYLPRPAAEVQAFIDAEHAETTYDPRYHGLYDDRFINPGQLPDALVTAWPRVQVAAWLSAWPGAELAGQVEAYRKRQGEFQLLRGLKSGELKLKGKTLTFREAQYTLRDVDRLLTQVDKELAADVEAFQHMDRDVCLAHWSLARHLDLGGGQGPVRQNELLARYRFHMEVQGLLQGMLGQQDQLNAVLAYISQNPQMAPEAFAEVRNLLSGVYAGLTQGLRDAEALRTPALTNVPAGSSLYTLIVDRGDTEVPPLASDTISGEWLGKLMTRVHGVLSRLKRVHFKSLGSLLAFQAKLADEGRARPAGVEDFPPSPGA